MHTHYGRDTDNGALVRQFIRKINNVIISSETWNPECLEVSVFYDEVPQELEIVDINLSSLEVVAINQYIENCAVVPQLNQVGVRDCIVSFLLFYK